MEGCFVAPWVSWSDEWSVMFGRPSADSDQVGYRQWWLITCYRCGYYDSAEECSLAEALARDHCKDCPTVYLGIRPDLP